MSDKPKNIQTIVGHQYDLLNSKLTVRVSMKAQPASYESLHVGADLESACANEDVEKTFENQSKLLRSFVGSSMEKMIRDYENGVAASFKQAARAKK
jgi:hypothetical protein